MINVLLLRQPPEDGTDSYEDHFLNAGYYPFSLPASETSYVSLTVLSDVLRLGLKANGFHGIILTSQRSCGALGKAFEILNNEGQSGISTDWDGVPIYVVGEKTASSLRDIFTQVTKIDAGSIEIRGQESGNATNLAAFILSDTQNRSGTKLLYLTGDKNRDTITRMLSEGNIQLEPLQVYGTQESPSFESRLSSILKMAPKGAKHWWIAYFAPSTASFVTPILKNYFDLREISPATTENSKTLLPTRIVAIGPTTHAFLIDQLRLRVDAMAQKPTPKDLVSSVEILDRSSPLY